MDFEDFVDFWDFCDFGAGRKAGGELGWVWGRLRGRAGG